MLTQTFKIPQDLAKAIDQAVTDYNARRAAEHAVRQGAYQDQVRRITATGHIPGDKLTAPVTPAPLSRSAALVSLLRVGIAHYKPSDLHPATLGRPRTVNTAPPDSAHERMMANIRADFARRAAAASARTEPVEAPAPRRKRAKPAK